MNNISLSSIMTRSVKMIVQTDSIHDAVNQLAEFELSNLIMIDEESHRLVLLPNALSFVPLLRLMILKS